ncbi:BTAD domain-containing putative transcriptional regulator [Streptomyces sp. CB03911]|uniref:AfsR/SARP family transcriptional regulator n=1 Tax=Streptomyces sp. CB03911 TaxID=1804758 RepID=UPI0018FEAFD1|nr:BTAD domain-containing putative transcriptional regulator [Streptomyces sp. CB03911]
MGIRLLGPIELRTTAGVPATVAGPKQRSVLALLAVEFDRVVPLGRFFDLLWGDEPPARARAALQGHVAALRKALDGTAFELRTRAPGYLLTGDAEQIDLCRFEALAARAEAAQGDDRAAAPLLKQALDLWYGLPLADLADTPLRRDLAERLGEARARVLAAWAERQLRLGLGAAAVPELESYVRTDGLREPAVALLMRCLLQDGRAPDALAAYHHARGRLDEELGIAPGPALQDALRAVLGTDGAGPPLPARRGLGPDPAREPAARERPAAPGLPCAAAAGLALPRLPDDLVGRAEEHRWLDRLRGPAPAGGGIAVVTGPAGVGKTATAVSWARQAPGFPDGRLFVPLRGFDPAGPAALTEVLGVLLRALGVPEAGLPVEPAARAALYRREAGRRRLLVVLDDARDAAQVAGLLPAGPHCVTVITARASLEEVTVTQGAALLQLGPLPEAEAAVLLNRLLPPGAVEAGTDARAAGGSATGKGPGADDVRRLAALCDGLPLALRTAAARLCARPTWSTATLTAALADERTRLHTLDTPGAAGLRSRLVMTYRHLPWDAAHLLALLTVHPDLPVDTGSAAALLDCDRARARRALAALADHHLLTEVSPGRHTQSGLVRGFGAELLAEQGDAVGRAAAVRLFDHYRDARAHRAALPEGVRPSLAPPAVPAAPSSAGPAPTG